MQASLFPPSISQTSYSPPPPSQPAPHIGHLHSMLLADVLARYTRLTQPGRPVIFSTGTDEHGLKIQNASRDLGVSAQEMCDRNSARFKVSFKNPLLPFFCRLYSHTPVLVCFRLWPSLRIYHIPLSSEPPNRGINQPFNTSGFVPHSFSFFLIVWDKRLDENDRWRLFGGLFFLKRTSFLERVGRSGVYL